MCVVIDSNCIPTVFNSESEGHEGFVPVLRWVTQGHGCIVYGGSKYRRELGKLRSYLKIFAELARKGRVVILPDKDVDEYARALKAKVTESAFNDEHIVAIVAISGCRVVCTVDKESYPFLHRRDLYPKGIKPPKIYSNKKHLRLCRESNIAACCKAI